MIYRVPVDDSSTLLYFLRFYPSDKRSMRLLRQEHKLGQYRELPADWWGIDVSDQDRMAVEQQVVVADRTKEHLGASDGGIVLMRRMMREALAAVRGGPGPALHHTRSGKTDRRIPPGFDDDGAEAGRRRLCDG